ncbi:MAG: hypothetical protein AAFY10_13200 [Pseudomonadota bacterium]
MSDASKKQRQPLEHGYIACRFDEIDKPGVYVNNHGEMFRVPEDALAEGRSPLMTWETAESNLVTRISEDAYTAISKCRQLAADCDLAVNF